MAVFEAEFFLNIIRLFSAGIKENQMMPGMHNNIFLHLWMKENSPLKQFKQPLDEEEEENFSSI